MKWANMVIAFTFAAQAAAPTPMPVPMVKPFVEPGVRLKAPEHIKQMQNIRVSDVRLLQPVGRPQQKPAAVSGGGGWHRDCRSQAGAVKQAVFDLGLGGDWFYIEYIFSRESCLDPGRLNQIGCRGLGQACPGSKLPCGAEDIKCQVKWFDGYAQRAHGGGWRNSYQFWLDNHWW